MIENRHLEPVFQIMLPALENANIEYWVYGGVGIAAYVGRFIRNNKDVDIFVKDADFETTKSLLNNLCLKNNFKLKSKKALKNGRPKFVIYIHENDKNEILSVVPIYLKENYTEFLSNEGSIKFSNQILEKVERDISGFKFFTPPDRYIKEIFLDFLILRGDKRKSVIDAFNKGQTESRVSEDAFEILKLDDVEKLKKIEEFNSALINLSRIILFNGLDQYPF